MLLETRVAEFGLEPFLPVPLPEAQSHDEQLQQEIWQKNPEQLMFRSEAAGIAFANETLAGKARGRYSAAELANLEGFLTEQGTLAIPIMESTVVVDGTARKVAMVAATEISANTTHGDMSSMVYLRDHIQTARSLMELHLQDPVRYAEEGKTSHILLESALHLMATSPQLARLHTVIEAGPQASQADWPQISLHFNDLEGSKPNGWRNKQDSFQMLAELTLDALDRNFLAAEDLLGAHKQFLASVVPLLAAVRFPRYESSGSWEEVEAKRTSVMAVETALLHKIQVLVQKDPAVHGFLQDGYEAVRAKLPAEARHGFTHTLDNMVQSGLEEIGRQLLSESPDYLPDSVQRRGADAAQTYLLMYDLPRLLADAHIPIGPDRTKMSAETIENLILERLSELDDPLTNGMLRYQGDAYLRANFCTNETQCVVSALKRKLCADAERDNRQPDFAKKQALRDLLVPQGREAAWTHPLGQLAGWAARRSLQEQSKNPEEAARYRELATTFLNRSLSTVTGENRWHAVMDENGQYQVRRAPGFRLPECYVTYMAADGKILVVPSPHTPLNWSSAATREGLGLLSVSTRQAELQEDFKNS